MTYTLTFDETVKGWTSFHSYSPDLMLRLNNDFYTVKQGQLYLHHVEDGGFNNFYGEQFTSSITTVLNDESGEDKIFKTMVTESDKSWKATLKTNYTESSLKSTEFNQRESKWFAYVRKSESTTDLRAVTQGLGAITSILGLSISFNEVPSNVNVGSELYQIVGEQAQLMGTIETIDGATITVDAFFNAPEFDAFCFSKKNPRIEGSEIRGYYLEVTLEDETTEQNELFSVGSEVVKSYL